MAQQVWTDYELLLLGKLIAEGFTNEQLAEALDRSVGSIQRKRQRSVDGPMARATTTARRGLPEQVKAERTCLRCRKKFQSEGIGNRICPTCKNSISHMAGNLEGVSA